MLFFFLRVSFISSDCLCYFFSKAKVQGGKAHKVKNARMRLLIVATNGLWRFAKNPSHCQ